MEWKQEQSTAWAALALETVPAWALWLPEVARRLRPHFPRHEARRRAWASSRGLRSPVARKNGGQLAAGHGATTPDGGQHVLGRARGDAEAVRDAWRADLVAHRGEPQAVWVIAETGCRKKGQPSVGVARQERGTAWRMEHGPSGMLRVEARRLGQALLDCTLWAASLDERPRVLCALGCPSTSLLPRSPRGPASWAHGLLRPRCQRLG